MEMKRFRFSIDRGGTFTDVYYETLLDGVILNQKVLKLLSVDPDNYKDAPTEGIRRALEQVCVRFKNNGILFLYSFLLLGNRFKAS